MLPVSRLCACLQFSEFAILLIQVNTYHVLSYTGREVLIDEEVE